MTRISFKFIIYPSCERVLKDGRVKSKIVRKSFSGDITFLTSHDYIWLLSICFLCCFKESIVVYQKWVSHSKKFYHYAKVVENARINFSISPYCTLLFSRKENFKFLVVALSAILCNGAVGCIIDVWEYQHWIPHWKFTCFLKTAIKAPKQGVKFVQT